MLTGVILAGKGAVTGEGGLTKHSEQLIKEHVSRMRKLCSEIIISTNEPRPYLLLFGDQVRIVTDFFRQQGPLAGLHASLSLAKNEAVWVADGELPIVSTRVATLLWEELLSGEWDAVLPMLHERVQLFHGIYRKGCSEKAYRLLQDNMNYPKSFLRQLNYTTLTEEYFRKRGVRADHLQKLMKIPVV